MLIKLVCDLRHIYLIAFSQNFYSSHITFQRKFNYHGFTIKIQHIDNPSGPMQICWEIDEWNLWLLLKYYVNSKKAFKMRRNIYLCLFSRSCDVIFRNVGTEPLRSEALEWTVCLIFFQVQAQDVQFIWLIFLPFLASGKQCSFEASFCSNDGTGQASKRPAVILQFWSAVLILLSQCFEISDVPQVLVHDEPLQRWLFVHGLESSRPQL